MCNICLLNIWPLTVTLTLSWHMGNMGFAYPLVEVNESFKIKGKPSSSKGVIERTRIGDGRTDRLTDQPTRQSESSIDPPHILWWGNNHEFPCNTCILNAFRLIKSAHVKTQHILVKMAFQDYVFIKKVCIKPTATQILNACSLNDQTNNLL